MAVKMIGKDIVLHEDAFNLMASECIFQPENPCRFENCDGKHITKLTYIGKYWNTFNKNKFIDT